jgi:hypothetical protein
LGYLEHGKEHLLVSKVPPFFISETARSLR